MNIKKEEIFKRGCGYRKLHGLYLCGEGMARECDRLPLLIEPCPTCGEELRFSRGVTKIDFVKIFGKHKKCKDSKDCWVCYPDPLPEADNFLMWVGSDYTEESFIAEATKYGVSKRISAIPNGLVVGDSIIYLAKKGNMNSVIGINANGKEEMGNGIFYAFKVMAVEYLITEAEAEDEDYVKDLNSRGITVSVVPNDYNPEYKELRKTREIGNFF